MSAICTAKMVMPKSYALMDAEEISQMQALYSSAYTKVYKSSWKKVSITEIVSSGLVTSVSVAKG